MTQNARLALWVPTATPPDVKDIIATQGPPVGSVIPTAFEQPGAGGGGTPSNAPPLMDGAVAPGTATAYSRGDHRHPTDTSKANASHTHPESDVTNLITDLAAKAPLVSPSLTGTPLTPTAAPGTNNTQIASTAFVGAAVSAGGGGGGIGEAPTDGQLYSRKGSTAQWLPSPTGSGGGLDQATADARYVNVAGDTMTGDLTFTTGSVYATSGTVDAMFVNGVVGQFDTIFAAADPTDPLELATKQYVDAHAGGGGDVTKAYVDAADATKLTKGIILSGTNLDTVTSPASYVCNSVTNGPPATTGQGYMLVENYGGDASYVGQRYHDLITGKFWTRIRLSSVWQSWIEYAAAADLAAKADKTYVDAQNTAQDTAITGKVAKAGDTMTGNLTIAKANSALVLNSSSGPAEVQFYCPANSYNSFIGYVNGHPRWTFRPGNSAAESGGNSGSDFSIISFDDSDNVLHNPLKITRADGLMTVKGDPTANLGVATKQYVDTKVAAGGGGGGAPGGATTQVQFNDAGAFAGDAGLTWDKTLKDLNIAGRIGWPAVSPDTWIQRNVAGSLEVWSSSGLNGDFKVRYITASSDLTLQGTNGKIVWNNDAGLARAGVGMVAAISNTNGQYRDFKARTFVMTQEAVNALECASKGYVDSKAAPAAATAAEYVANSAPTKMLTPGAAWAAAAPVVLSEVAGVATLNFATGLDFTWTLGGAGRTLANPTNGKPGQKGIIWLIYGASGTITTWGSNWKFPGGVKPAGALNSVDAISYVVGGDGTSMYCTSAVDFK